MTKDELVTYWSASSDLDFNTMRHLYEKEDYHWCLFVGHLVIEKLLKAYYVQTVDLYPPFTHQLARLAEKSNLPVSDEQKEQLAVITTFNINARYDTEKMEFYKKCTPEFTTEWVTRIEELRVWIKVRLLPS